MKDELRDNGAPQPTGRRKFLGTIGVAASAAAGALANPAGASARTSAEATAALPANVNNNRVAHSFQIRVEAATQQALVPVPPHTTNGDEQRYPNALGTFTKAILQQSPCIVDPTAYQSFRTALSSGKFSDFEKIIVGGTKTLNGPQGGLAYELEGSDSIQFGNAPSPANQESAVLVPPPPALASPAYGTELMELYWGSLMRDVPFAEYGTNAIAAAACAELGAQPTYAGPKVNGQVTPGTLFRGNYQGETVGPYVTQFLVTPTMLGQQPISQQFNTYAPNVDYMTDPALWFDVQNGIDTHIVNQNDPQLRYLRAGRDLAAWTHVDVLFQAYFTALLTFLTIGVPTNPGNPYNASKTENGFTTLGAPDFAGTLCEVATRALKAVWYQKWFVHLRHRPEAGGGIVQQILTGNGASLGGSVNSNVLNSQAVAMSFQKNGSYLLSCAFPEGSPTHPAYPTGHGTVGGACITILKFFFDGSFVIPNPVVPSSDGLSLQPYTGSDAGQMTVNGELNKLARNITFGHGIHAGIHWRSDSDYSMLLGEAVALSMLRDRALLYNEPFTVQITKLDGTIATISNQS